MDSRRACVLRTLRRFIQYWTAVADLEPRQHLVLIRDGPFKSAGYLCSRSQTPRNQFRIVSPLAEMRGNDMLKFRRLHRL